MGVKGRKIEAIRCYQTAASLQPLKPAAWCRLGDACQEAGQYIEGAEAFSRSVVLSKAKCETHFSGETHVVRCNLLPILFSRLSYAMHRALDLEGLGGGFFSEALSGLTFCRQVSGRCEYR